MCSDGHERLQRITDGNERMQRITVDDVAVKSKAIQRNDDGVGSNEENTQEIKKQVEQ